jgi:hypothetical protein
MTLTRRHPQGVVSLQREQKHRQAFDVKAHVGPRVKDARLGKPNVDELRHTLPREAVFARRYKDGFGFPLVGLHFGP